MKKNYLILAHKNPLQLKKMIDHLNDDDTFFYVHIDLKTDINIFKSISWTENVHFIEDRTRCIWGDFSIVKATISLMEQAQKDKQKGFFILMSGQDFPLQSPKQINAFFEKDVGCDFIEITPIEEKWKRKMVRDKIEHYHILHSEKRGDSSCYAPYYHTDIRQKIRIWIHRLKGRLSKENYQKLKTFHPRSPIFEQQYGGSQFWTFSEKTFYKILAEIQLRKNELVSYYQYSSTPDELFFHTILMHLAQNDREIKIKPPLTYVNYFRKNNVFITQDRQILTEAKGYHLFARKFDTDIDSQILDLLITENQSV